MEVKQKKNHGKDNLQLNERAVKFINQKKRRLHQVERFEEVHSTARKVYVHVAFLKFGEVNTLTEKFDGDVLVKCRWREPKLDIYKTEDDEPIPWEELWNPNISIENAMGEPQVSCCRTTELDTEGRVWAIERKRFKGTFMETLELWDFPFDVQDLSVFVRSEYPMNQVRLLQDPKEVHKINRDNFIDEQEWYLFNYLESAKCERSRDPIDPTTKCFAIMVRAKAARRPAYFLFNNFLVTFLIVVLCFTTFSVEPDLPQNRLQLSFTLVLTAVAFKFVVNQSLPKLSYLTYLDRYVLACMIMLITLSVWHSAQILIPIERFPNKDHISIAVFAGLYFIYNLYFWLRIYFGPYKVRREMKWKEVEYVVKLQESSASRGYINKLTQTTERFDMKMDIY